MSQEEAKKIIETIKEKHIQPESSFKLHWKSYAFWTIWILMLIFGALFVSLIIFNFMDIRPSFFLSLKIGRIMHWLFFTAPIFWILLSLGALIFGMLAFRKTKRGYRYSLLFVTSLTVLIASILGMIFHFSRVNDRMREGFFSESSREFRRMAFPIEGRWQEPETGFLAGEIEELNEDNFHLKTSQGERWTVFYSTDVRGTEKEFFCNNSQIGVVGEKRGEYEFEAEAIGPFPRREFEFEKRRMPGHMRPTEERSFEESFQEINE